MHHERLNRIVGGVALVIVVAAVTAVLAMGDQPLTQAVQFTIMFDRVGRLRVGAPVKMNDIVVGQVASIRFAAAKGPSSAGAPPGAVSGSQKASGQAKNGADMGPHRFAARVKVEVWIRRRYRKFVRVNSIYLITAQSIISARHVEVMPPKGDPGRMVRSGDLVEGVSPARLDRMLQMTYANLKTSTDLINSLKPDLISLRSQARRLRALYEEFEADLDHVVGSWRKTRQAYNEARPAYRAIMRATDKGRRLDRLDRRLRAVADRAGQRLDLIRGKVRHLASEARHAKKYLAGLRVTATKKRVTKTIDRLDRAIASAETMVKRIRRAIDLGLGTVGALSRDHEIWDDFKASQRTVKQRIWTLFGKGKQSSPKGYPMP